MRKRIMTLGAIVLALGVAGPSAAIARNGSDDPLPHARHGADDGLKQQVSHSSKAPRAAKKATKRLDDRRGRQHRHGRDDGPNHR